MCMCYTVLCFRVESAITNSQSRSLRPVMSFRAECSFFEFRHVSVRSSISLRKKKRTGITHVLVRVSNRKRYLDALSDELGLNRVHCILTSTHVYAFNRSPVCGYVLMNKFSIRVVIVGQFTPSYALITLNGNTQSCRHSQFNRLVVIALTI